MVVKKTIVLVYAVTQKSGVLKHPKPGIIARRYLIVSDRNYSNEKSPFWRKKTILFNYGIIGVWVSLLYLYKTEGFL
ncbi:MAG: hypothetical protein BWY54_00231 [Candidatus Dependentiae bacterium ADurb.Bin331]|nr:MAG: hypothetical protein BWY54_00231 [Candidatus Dependentiae bacterium ADurb.Bin331]